MPQQAPLQPGDPRRVGRYRLAGRIAGLPADGPVFLGSSPDGAEVTISVLRSDWTSDAAGRDRFAAEAAVAKRVPPFCAARILDAGLDGGDAYLVSEYVPGRSLLEIISASGVLPEADLGPVAIGMATGLASVHQAGLVHGNFGPEYVIMTSSGPRVVEFGITPPYGSATPSADMLAWARTILFTATGRPGAGAGDLTRLSDPLRGLVARCMGQDPSGRLSARSVVLELLGADDPPDDPLADGARLAIRAAFRPPAEIPERDEIPRRDLHPATARSRAIWWAAAFLACVLAIAVAVHVLQNQSAARSAAANGSSTAQPPSGASAAWQRRRRRRPRRPRSRRPWAGPGRVRRGNRLTSSACTSSSMPAPPQAKSTTGAHGSPAPGISAWCLTLAGP